MIGGRNPLYVTILYLISIYSCTEGTCPSGWNKPVGNPLGCYKVSLEQKSYQEHEVSCRDNGGHLASIHSENELRAVTSLLWRENGNFFIGLNDIWKEGRWEYSDSTPFDFENWAYGEPNNVGDEDCVEMKTSGKWNDISCSRRCGAVCKLERTDYTVGNEHVTDYVTIMGEHSDGTVTTAESKILSEYVTDLYSERSVSSEVHGISTGHSSTEYNGKTDYTVGNKHVTDYETIMKEHSDKTVTTAETEIPTEYATGVYKESAGTSEINEFPTELFSTEYSGKTDYTVGNEHVTDYETIMKEHSDRTVTTAETKILTEYATDVYRVSAGTSEINEFPTELFSTEYSGKTDYTGGNEHETEYETIMKEHSDRTVTTAETEIPTEYATGVYRESVATSEINKFPTEHFSTEYSAATSTENDFLTEYLTKGLRDADQNCPGEWLRYNNFCFFLDTTRRMFRDAKIACQTRGGELASIHSEEEQSFVYSILREDVQSHFIGLTFDTQSKTWNYTDGTTLDFTNWYPNMPDHQEFENCVEVYFYHDGKWNDVSCFSPFNGAVCKATLGSSLVSGPLNEPDRSMIECGSGWLNYYDESLYCFINVLLQWTEAAQMCADYGGHLVSIQDKYENDFLVKAMENFYVEFVWIGMNDLHEEGVWRWENSHIIPSYTNWDYLEPNNFHNEDCAVMYLYWNFRPRKGAWYDNACCHEFPSICKKQF